MSWNRTAKLFLLVAGCIAASISRPVHAAEIVVGMSAAFRGVNRALGIELYRGATACFEQVNEQGGVHGRNIVIRAYDDGYNPGPALENTVRFIQEDKVLLLFGYVGTPTATRVLPVLKRYERDQQGVQLFFPFTGADVLREPPYSGFVYNLRTSYRQEVSGLVDHFVRIGRKRIGVFYQVDVYGRTGWDGVREALQKHRLKIAAEATYRRGAAFDQSMREQVDILRRENLDAIIAVGAYGPSAAFIRDARDAGWDVPIANVSFVGSENMLAMLLQKGEKYTRNLINSQVVPSYHDLSIPAVREYRAAMEKVQPLPPPNYRAADYQPHPLSFVGFEGYLDAKLLVEILRRAGKNPDRRAVREAADGLTDFSLGLGPDALISFRPDDHQGLMKIYFTVVRGDRFVSLLDDDWKEWQQ